MKIELENAGKAFNQTYLFRNLSFVIESGSAWRLLGENGSGKSTLMKMLSAQLAPTEGRVVHSLSGQTVEPETVYARLSWNSPAIELYPYLTVGETLGLHFRFKTNLLKNVEEVLEKIVLREKKDKQLRQLSSGQLQRVKIALALFSDSDLLLLDEPTSFMDEKNAQLVLQLIEQYKGRRTYILASNNAREYEGIGNTVRLGAA